MGCNTVYSYLAISLKHLPKTDQAFNVSLCRLGLCVNRILNVKLCIMSSSRKPVFVHSYIKTTSSGSIVFVRNYCRAKPK